MVAYMEVHTAQISGISDKLPLKKRFVREIKKHKYVYLMAVPVILYYVIFSYIPMYGAQIAFRKYSLGGGFSDGEWVGLQYFADFMLGPYFWRLMRNTLMISLKQLIFNFPAPIILAILLNELSSVKFKRTVQTVIYLPHFISLVVICGLIRTFVSRDGFITDFFVNFMGMNRANMLGSPEFFQPIYIISGIWQGVGWGSIVYLSALSGIDVEQYEAAVVDGAGRFQQIIKITLPGISPTIVTMLILQLGRTMSVGFEKIILLYNPSTYETADVISSYVYRLGLAEGSQFSYTTAIGLFSSVINFILIIMANSVSRKVNESGLW